MRKKHKAALMVLIVVLAAGIFGASMSQKKVQSAEQEEPLKVTLLKVGKADAIVIQTSKENMVIDTGEEEDGEELVMFLKNQGISRVDTLLITHYDQDHVGGADTLMESMETERVIIPDYEGHSVEYLDFMKAMEQREIVPERVNHVLEFSLGDAEVIVEPPDSYRTEHKNVEMDNNFSLITTINHGENKMIFAGDAEKQRIKEWLKNGQAEDCDFLKVPHHGVYNTALEKLFQKLKPEYAVICTSKKNPADVQTVELLKKYNAHVFQTKDGNITLVSDGRKLEMKQELEH